MLRFDIDDGIAIITFNRPAKRNALNTEMLERLGERLDEARSDERIKAVILTGEGSAFCSGIDLGEFAAGVPAQHRTDLLLQRLLDLLHFPKPLVSAVNGFAVGAGAAIAISADMVVMANTARFGYPEAGHGMVPTLMVANLVAQVGSKAAFELLISSKLVDAARVAGLGLANRIVDSEEVMPEARRLAVAIAALEPGVAERTKGLIQAYVNDSIEQSLRLGRG